MVKKGVENIKEYTLAAFLVNVHVENWIPTYGDMLTCSIAKGDVRVLYGRNVVGEIPQPLMTMFADFLQCGTIHARVAGALINQGFGEKVPVDYTFVSNIDNVNHVILELKSR